MVIEHDFVTTLEPTDALRRSADYLSARGFSLPGGPVAFSMDQARTALEMERGKKASRAKNVAQLPQRVRVEWDRGRVSIALSIAANAAWGGSSFTLTSAAPGNPKKMRLHAQLLQSIAKGLETLLACDGPGQTDYTEWDGVEREIFAAARRRTLRLTITFIVIMLLLGGVIALIIANA